jgi:meckelin
MRFVNATKFSSSTLLRKTVRIFRQNPSCKCDDKSNENYRNKYCIKSELFKDLKSHQYYKNLPLTQTLNLSYELKFIVFFCKILHQRNYCNYLANICVLTHFDLDKNGPCFAFYKQQNQQNGLTIDDGGNEGFEFDDGEKLKPFLFFRNQKFTKSLFEKFIDFSYGVNNVS